MADETSSLADVIRTHIAAFADGLHVAMPGAIVSYDVNTGMAAVQPAIKRRDGAGSGADLPVIPNVPVVFPRAGAAYISMPLKKGDEVQLVFGERSIDQWKLTGGRVDPGDRRRFSLADAVAYPGGYPMAKPLLGASSDAIVITATDGKTTKLSLASDGEIRIDGPFGGYFAFKANSDIEFDTGTVKGRLGGGGKIEFENKVTKFVAQILAVLDLAMQSKVATSMGLQPLIPDPTYPAERAKLDSFKE